MAQKINQRGFTLVELLVVISIVSFISSIALIGLNTARVRAQDTAIGAQVNQVQRALITYSIDKDGYPNPVPGDPGPYCVGSNTCSIAGIQINRRLNPTGFEFGSVQNMPSTNINGNQTLGYLYLSCGSFSGNCPDHSVRILYPTSLGVVYREPEGASSQISNGYCTGPNPVYCQNVVYTQCVILGCGQNVANTHCSSTDTIPCAYINSVPVSGEYPAQTRDTCLRYSCNWVAY